MNSNDFLPLLFDAASKSAILLGLVLGLAWLFPKAAAATRHLGLVIALCACLGLPLLTLALPTWRIPLLAAPQNSLVKTPRSVKSPLTKISYAPSFEEFNYGPPVSITTSAAPQTPVDWSLIVFALWAVGAWLVLARMLMGTMLVWLLRYKAQQLASAPWQSLIDEASAALRLKRKVTLIASNDAAMPMTTGIFKPVILLPSAAAQWSREQLRTVLMHELAHVKRHDCLTQLLGTLACTLYWFNPLVWGAAQQLRKMRELACDDEVLVAGTRASDYASCLVGVAKSVEGAHYSSPIAVGMACSHLEDRVSSILNPVRNRRLLSRRYVVMITLLMASLIIPLASFQPFAQVPVPVQQQQVEQRQEALAAEQKARMEAQQQSIERHRQEIEQHLREIEKHRQALTEVQRQELEQRLREVELIREKALSAADQHRLAAELDRAYAESQRMAGEKAEDAHRRALEEQLRAESRVAQGQQRRALEDAQRLELTAQQENAAQGEAMLRLKRAELEAELMRLRTQYKENHPTMLEKRDQFEALNRTVDDFVKSQAKSNVEAMLLLRKAELDAHLQTMLRLYTEKHPDVQAVKAQIEALKKEIEQLHK